MRWKSRFIAFVICFIIGFLVAAIVAALWSRFSRKQNEVSPCAAADYFNSPEEVLAALKHPEVDVRRTMHQRLLLRPDSTAVLFQRMGSTIFVTTRMTGNGLTCLAWPMIARLELPRFGMRVMSRRRFHQAWL